MKFDVSPETEAHLRKLAQRLELSPVDTVRLALAFLDLAYDHHGVLKISDGQSFRVADFRAAFLGKPKEKS